MAINSVSTYANFLRTLSNITGVQSRLINIQDQMSSGLRSRYFSGMAADTTKYLDIESQLSRTDSYLANNTLIAARLDATATALTQIKDTVTSIRSLIQTRRSGGITQTAFATQLESNWKTLVSSSQLNAVVNSQYLFSGTRSDYPAVVSNTFPLNTALNADYYQGSSQDYTVRIQDGVDIVSNVRADSDAFRKIFTGLALAAAGNRVGTASDNADLTAAYDLIDQGISGIIAAKAGVDFNKALILDTNKNLTAFQVYATGLKKSLSETDLPAISTEFANLQGILQASFSVYGQLSNLRLTDYLR